jgi:isoleucyl-tRNA synthetase
MVSSRPDWCISRQRVWGVPIVVFYCEKCREPLTDRKILDAVVDLFAQHSADVWFERSTADLVPAGTVCSKCGSTGFTKENDILDVWFDSGSSHLAVLTEENGLRWPADLYLEGGDQYRGWFQSSLLIGVGLRDQAPYRATATHGWTLDGDGRPLSKSIGNGVAPEEIIKEYGAELIRLWTASVDFVEDVRISPLILTRLSEAYRKIRNTFRYALGNIHDFDPARDAVPGEELVEIDQWILVRAEELVSRCRIWYDEFAFHKVYRAVYDFATVDLSSIYFDVLKDRLYTSATKSHARRSVANWDRLIGVRNDVLKSLEAARNEKLIGAPLEARVELSADSELYPLLQEYSRELPGLFIVSQVDLRNHASQAVAVKIGRAHGTKCERCWKYTEDVGSAPELPTVCASCAAAVREITQQT